MIAAVAALLWWDHHLQQTQVVPVGVPLGALTLLLVVLGYRELAHLAKARLLPVELTSGVVCSVILAAMPVWLQLIPAQAGLTPMDQATLPLLVLGGALAIVFFMQMARHRTEQAIQRLAGTLLGVIYLGGMGAAILAVRVRFGMPATLLFLAVVKFTDMGAYFTGSFFGKHKLIPWLSPGKSWEGLGGGLAAAAIVSIVLSLSFGIMQTLWQAALFGVLVGLVGQFGDLCESLLKRDAGIKDSGAIVPGFGGVLDIVDSLLITAPLTYLLLMAWRHW